jgi:NADPH:quinone reductase-like Zn-dependent oxidoreductase
MFVRQQAGPSLKTQNHDDLIAVKELVEAGKVMPVVDGTYPLNETPGAIDRVATGRARGTIVIAVPGMPHAAVAPENSAAEAVVGQPALA